MYSVFLRTGLGKEHKILRNFNTMKECKNSPFGCDSRLMISDPPLVTKINISIP
jgi:hypothetical protein